MLLAFGTRFSIVASLLPKILDNVQIIENENKELRFEFILKTFVLIEINCFLKKLVIRYGVEVVWWCLCYVNLNGLKVLDWYINCYQSWSKYVQIVLFINDNEEIYVKRSLSTYLAAFILNFDRLYY